MWVCKLVFGFRSNASDDHPISPNTGKKKTLTKSPKEKAKKWTKPWGAACDVHIFPFCLAPGCNNEVCRERGNLMKSCLWGLGECYRSVSVGFFLRRAGLLCDFMRRCACSTQCHLNAAAHRLLVSSLFGTMSGGWANMSAVCHKGPNGSLKWSFWTTGPKTVLQAPTPVEYNLVIPGPMACFFRRVLSCLGLVASKWGATRVVQAIRKPFHHLFSCGFLCQMIYLNVVHPFQEGHRRLEPGLSRSDGFSLFLLFRLGLLGQRRL